MSIATEKANIAKALDHILKEWAEQGDELLLELSHCDDDYSGVDVDDLEPGDEPEIDPAITLGQLRRISAALAMNAYLLHAARQGLEALEGVDRLLHQHGFMQGIECPAIPILKDAIAKAEQSA